MTTQEAHNDAITPTEPTHQLGALVADEGDEAQVHRGGVRVATALGDQRAIRNTALVEVLAQGDK